MLLDNYTCQYCGERSSELHVHHLIKFIDIFNAVLKKFNTNKNIRSNDILFDIIIEEVLHKHSIFFGITLCKKCHSLVDYKYRSKKGESKNREECERREKSLQLPLWAE